MTKESSDKLLLKVASLEKAPRLLASVIAMRKQASVTARKQEVQTKLASIVDGVMHKKAAPIQAAPKAPSASFADAAAEIKDIGGNPQTLTNYQQNLANNATPTNQGFFQNVADLIYGVPYKRGLAKGHAFNNLDTYLKYLQNKKIKEQASKPYYR